VALVYLVVNFLPQRFREGHKACETEIICYFVLAIIPFGGFYLFYHKRIISMALNVAAYNTTAKAFFIVLVSFLADIFVQCEI
jgi:hypothetical protein